MLALGLIVIAAAAALGGFAAWAASSSTTTTTMSMLGADLALSPLHFFGAGAAAVLLLWLGFRLTVAGTKRRAAQRRELRELRKVEATRPQPERARDTMGNGTMGSTNPAERPGGPPS